jgi:hypothetical protein
VNPFTRALEPPFIGKRKDFYILRLPSNLENIPGVNMYKNVFYPAICRTNFTYLQACHRFTPQTRTFEATSLTWSSFDLRTFIHENHHSPGSPNWASGSTSEERFLKLPEAHSFMVSRIRPIPAVLKQK